MAAQHERAEQFVPGGDGGDPVVPVPHGVALGPGGLQGAGGCRRCLGELDGAVQHLGDGGGHVVHPAAAQDQFGQPVVDVGGALDDGAAVLDDLVGPLQAAEGLAGLGEQVGRVDGGRGERREGAEQGDLLPLEHAGAAVGGEQHPDDMVSERQGHPEDRDEPFVAHPAVDGVGVLEAVVAEVVVRDVRPGGLGDEAAESLAHAEAQLLEAGRHRALGDPHVGVAPLRVVEAEVGDVGAEQGAGALHDRAQHGVQVAQPGEVVGGLEQGGQLGLPAAAPLDLGAHAQGEQLGPLQGRDPLGGAALGAGEQHGLLVGLGGGAAGEQLQERRLRAVGGGPAGVGAGPVRRSGGGGPFGGLQVIAGHGSQDSSSGGRPVSPVENSAGRRPAAVGVRSSARSSRRPGRGRCR